jgi:DNA topoisomerase-2
MGHLLTGSNFDDAKAQVTGGRHGYGAKLANIFSSSFTVETVDAVSRQRYRQVGLRVFCPPCAICETD